MIVSKKISKITKRGNIIVISGPSGSGKGTLISQAMTKDSNLCYAVSATTRAQAFGEKEGINYYFKTEDEFTKLIDDGDVLEWDSFCGHRYGTLKSEILRHIEAGNDVILDLTVPGAEAVKKAFPQDTVTAFILPPSVQELENRIRNRKRETDDAVIKARVSTALQEISHAREFDYIIVNDVLNIAVSKLCTIIEAQRLTYKYNKDILDRLEMKGEN